MPGAKGAFGADNGVGDWLLLAAADDGGLLPLLPYIGGLFEL